MFNTDDAHARNWPIAGLLFFAGLFNYLDRVTLLVALPVISLGERPARGIFWISEVEGEKLQEII